jgi:D-threo-aldose 1-dehydrogenase
MQNRLLGATGVTTSQLGFGCVQLTTHRDRRDAIRILEHALDVGITHFDVAPAYGFGRAEWIVGDFLLGNRHRVTVATKFGIQPPSGFMGRGRVIELAKKILRPFPALLRGTQRLGSQMGKAGVFTPENCVRSLESSLKALRTDCIDIFLLHEATFEDADSDSLIEVLQQQVLRGKIRSFGIASHPSKLANSARRLPADYQILQFGDNIKTRNLQSLGEQPDRAVITHSIFRPYSLLCDAVVSHSDITKNYSDRINLDLTDPTILGLLLLQFAIRGNAGGCVLFSSTNPERITHDVRAVEYGVYSDVQLREFMSFTDQILQSGYGVSASLGNDTDTSSSGVTA